MELRYIAIEGVIGVGKTELAKILAKRLNAECILEEVEENPFLSNFYQDMRGYSFQTQIFFLLSRHKQQQSLAQRNLFIERIVSDYLFDKDRIFAYLNLTEHELVLYEKLYQFLVKDIRKPDLVVYLQARIETLLERIRKRGRPFERDITSEYLQALADSYNRFFLHYDATPVLIVNTENLDFINNQQDFESLYKAIISAPGGRIFYSPKGEKRRRKIKSS
uniref:Deoxynucleoside kinase n=1 Tax=candidate division WOR-3 bacterium TaxID=2052148 RepID=A0A7C6EC67_UNCW3